MLLFEFIQLMAKEEQLVDFLIQHGVVPSIINCDKCNNEINIHKETLLFRYRKGFLTIEVSKQCDHKSTKIGTWFGHSNLNIVTICKIVACFLMYVFNLRPPRQEDLEEELGISSATVVD